MTNDLKVHRFEAAGLGPAPYRYLGCEKVAYQACQGAPIQPGGCCEYCGTGIIWRFYLRAADGREFYVGGDCILRAGDAGLQRAIAVDVRKHEREVKDAREQKVIAAFDAHLDAHPEFWEARGAGRPHPSSYYAGRGKTFADYLQFCWASSGQAGRAKLARRYLKELGIHV